MLEFFAPSKEDAIAILKSDHDKVKAIFERFENTDNLREKKRLAAEAIMELKIHAEIEERIFYPTVRKELEEDVMNEADEEHHVAKLLIAELDLMDGSEDHWEAKFTVLAENIRHHIKEEENEMLPEARRLDIDFEALGRKLLAKKEQLKKDGVPVSDEERLMAMRGKLADSPARAAKQTSRKTRAKAKPGARKTAKNGSASKTRSTRKAPARSAKKAPARSTAKRRRS